MDFSGSALQHSSCTIGMLFIEKAIASRPESKRGRAGCARWIEAPRRRPVFVEQIILMKQQIRVATIAGMQPGAVWPDSRPSCADEKDWRDA